MSLASFASSFGLGPTAPPRRAAHTPLAGLAGTDLSSRFCYWRGDSGRRYLFSVFGLARHGSNGCPRFDDAVVLAVSHKADGRREVIDIIEWGGGLDGTSEEDRLAHVAVGANEIHVHLLTEDRAGRLAIIRDLGDLGLGVGALPDSRSR